MTVTRAASKRNGRARRFPRHFANLRKPRKSTVRTGRNRQGFSAHTHRESPKISQWHIRAVWRPCCWRRMYAQDTVRHLSQPSEAAIVIHSPGSRRPEPLFDLGGADGFAAISGPWGSGKNESEVGETAFEQVKVQCLGTTRSKRLPGSALSVISSTPVAASAIVSSCLFRHSTRNTASISLLSMFASSLRR
jgi:hypothetical protein